MNCLCGYKDDPNENTFIEIQTITRKTDIYDEYMKDYQYDHFSLIACPKCGTVKLKM